MLFFPYYFLPPVHVLRIKDDDILLRICLLHQAQCADTEEGLKRQKRSSELTNRKLHKDFEDAYSATQALQMKVEVLVKLDNNQSYNNLILNLTIYNCCVGKLHL